MRIAGVRPRRFRALARRFFAAAVLLPLMCRAPAARAELPGAMLETLFPPGGQAGARLKIRARGSDLDGGQIVFTNPGITGVAGPDQTSAASLDFEVRIGANVIPGIYEARILSHHGISTPRAFVVSDSTEAAEARAAHRRESARVIEPDQWVDGRAEKAQLNFYKIRLEKGERVWFDNISERIDSKALMIAAISDESGEELTRSLPGQSFGFSPRRSGWHWIELHDFLYQGGSEFFYRIRVSRRTHIVSWWPLAARLGEAGELHALGWNLGAAAETILLGGRAYQRAAAPFSFVKELGTDKMLVLGTDTNGIGTSASRSARAGLGTDPKPGRRRGAADFRFGRGRIPRFSSAAALGIETVECRWRPVEAARGVSNPFFLAAASAPVILEKEPNDLPESAQTVPVPCEIDGEFFPARDRDWYQFSAKKGEIFWIEIYSARLAMGTFPFLLIQEIKPDNGAHHAVDLKEMFGTESNWGGVEFKSSHRDCAWEFNAPETARYRIEARDLFHENQCDPGCRYRLVIRPPSPRFALAALPVEPVKPDQKPDQKPIRPASIFLRRGARFPLTIFAERQDGFDGEIELSARRLPPGVRAEPGRIERGRSRGFLMLEAGPDATNGWAEIEIVGRAKTTHGELRAQATPGAVLWPTDDPAREPVAARLGAALAIAATGDAVAPAELQLPRRRWEAAPGQKLELSVSIRRDQSFQGKGLLWLGGAEVFNKFHPVEIAEKATNATLSLEWKELKLAPGPHAFYVAAEISGTYQRRWPKGAKPSGVTARFYSRQLEIRASDAGAERGERSNRSPGK